MAGNVHRVSDSSVRIKARMMTVGPSDGFTEYLLLKDVQLPNFACVRDGSGVGEHQQKLLSFQISLRLRDIMCH